MEGLKPTFYSWIGVYMKLGKAYNSAEWNLPPENWSTFYQLEVTRCPIELCNLAPHVVVAKLPFKCIFKMQLRVIRNALHLAGVTSKAHTTIRPEGRIPVRALSSLFMSMTMGWIIHGCSYWGNHGSLLLLLLLT